jgi:outer membrane receptor protein involved in Fe transport
MSDSLRLRSLLAMSVSAAALMAIAAPAYAADADASNSGATTVGEVVVTAQKKEERLQDVPIAVSAFSQDSLEKQKIDGGPNLVLAIPNVNFSKGNFTGYNFQIRGVGSKLVATSGDAGTGIHLNNAPLTANNLFEAEFRKARCTAVTPPAARSTSSLPSRPMISKPWSAWKRATTARASFARWSTCPWATSSRCAWPAPA